MPNIARVLRDEITRLARKEAKAAVTPVRKPGIQARKSLADLKNRIAALEKAGREIQDLLSTLLANMPATPVAEKDKARITAKGMRALRRKLRLTKKDFGRLIGVTDQAVNLWEKKSGALRLKGVTRTAILGIRGLGAREVRKRLDAFPRHRKAVKAKRRGK